VGEALVKFLHYIFNPAFWVCPYLTQNWVKTTQHFLECSFMIYTSEGAHWKKWCRIYFKKQVTHSINMKF